LRRLSASVKVGLLVIGSRLLGLLRDSLLAKYLGSGWVSDAFFTAFRIPNMLRDLLGEGALSSIVVARLGKMEGEEPARVKSFVQKLIAFWGCLLVLLTLIGIGFAPWIVEVLAQGFKDNPEQFQLTKDLTRMIFPYMTLVGLCALSMGILHHKKVFGWASSASIFFNLSCICIMVVYAEVWKMTDPLEIVFVIAGSIVVGGAAQWMCLWPSLWKTGLSLKPVLDLKDSEVLQVVRMLGPAIISVAAVQINVAVNVAMATTLEEGSATSINYAFRIMQLPVGIVGVSIATVLLPKLSQHVANQDKGAFSKDFSDALKKVTFLTFPAIFGLLLLGPSLIEALYERGKFDAKATNMTWYALQGYLLGIFPYVLNKNLIQGYFANSDTKTPVIISFCSILVNFSLNYTLVYGYDLGVRGLTFGTSCVLLVNTLLLYLGLNLKHGLMIKWKHVLGVWTKQIFCALMMLVFIYKLVKYDFHYVEVKVLLCTGVGGLVYFGWDYILKKLRKS